VVPHLVVFVQLKVVIGVLVEQNSLEAVHEHLTPGFQDEREAMHGGWSKHIMLEVIVQPM
jgi:hypothetical protein